MQLSIKTMLTTNLALKIISCIMGICFWIIWGATYTGSLSYDIPVCFYGSYAEQVTGPESISITLAGKRTDLYSLDLHTLALHINTDELKPGDQVIGVTPEKLFLPSSVKLVNWVPLNPIITLEADQHA